MIETILNATQLTEFTGSFIQQFDLELSSYTMDPVSMFQELSPDQLQRHRLAYCRTSSKEVTKSGMINEKAPDLREPQSLPTIVDARSLEDLPPPIPVTKLLAAKTTVQFEQVKERERRIQT